jgi:hypothetical protein
MTQTRRVIQERQVTDLFENELKHVIQPDDVLLNLAQLHSAALVQNFQPFTRYPNLTRDVLIRTAIRNRHILEGSPVAEDIVPPANTDQFSRLPSPNEHPTPTNSLSAPPVHHNQAASSDVVLPAQSSRKRSRTNTMSESTHDKRVRSEPAHPQTNTSMYCFLYEDDSRNDKVFRSIHCIYSRRSKHILIPN